MDPMACIDNLPEPVLYYIFHMLLDMSSPCTHDRFLYSKHTPVRLRLLVQVCRRWQEIVYRSPTFWSHIDLSTDRYLLSPYFDRLRERLARIDQSPVEIHIADPVANNGFAPQSMYMRGDPGYSIDFILQEGTRIRSLDISLYCADMDTLDSSSAPNNYCGTVFFKLSTQSNPVPQLLKQLILTCSENLGYEQVSRFIPTDEPGGRFNPLSDIPPHIYQKRLEEFLQPVTCLRLKDLFLPWSSAAYHGLVELCIQSSRVTITTPQFRHILESSPRLRVIKLGLEVIPTTEAITPVQLDELESVISVTREYRSWLQLLAPGAKPIHFSIIKCSAKETVISGSEISLFMGRANIASICAGNLSHYEEILQLLRWAPRARRLILTSFENVTSDSLIEGPELFTAGNLEELHLLNSCILDYDVLEHIIKQYGVQYLVISKRSQIICKSTREDEASEPGAHDEQDFLDALAKAGVTTIGMRFVP